MVKKAMYLFRKLMYLTYRYLVRVSDYLRFGPSAVKVDVSQLGDAAQFDKPAVDKPYYAARAVKVVSASQESKEAAIADLRLKSIELLKHLQFLEFYMKPTVCWYKETPSKIIWRAGYVAAATGVNAELEQEYQQQSEPRDFVTFLKDRGLPVDYVEPGSWSAKYLNNKTATWGAYRR